MSSSAVGFWFSLAVLGWWAAPIAKARIAAKREKLEECHRLGHQWGEPFSSALGRHRNCRRCNRQQHYHADTQEWL